VVTLGTIRVVHNYVKVKAGVLNLNPMIWIVVYEKDSERRW